MKDIVIHVDDSDYEGLCRLYGENCDANLTAHAQEIFDIFLEEYRNSQHRIEPVEVKVLAQEYELRSFLISFRDEHGRAASDREIEDYKKTLSHRAMMVGTENIFNEKFAVLVDGEPFSFRKVPYSTIRVVD